MHFGSPGEGAESSKLLICLPANLKGQGFELLINWKKLKDCGITCILHVPEQFIHHIVFFSGHILLRIGGFFLQTCRTFLPYNLPADERNSLASSSTSSLGICRFLESF